SIERTMRLLVLVLHRQPSAPCRGEVPLGIVRVAGKSVTPSCRQNWTTVPAVGAFRPAHRREVVMKAIYWTIAAASFACAELVHAGINDPEVNIYRGAGVVDTGGGDFSGNATAFHCTNFSGTNENIRFVVRNTNGALSANTAFTVPHLNTGTVVTKQTGLFA